MKGFFVLFIGFVFFTILRAMDSQKGNSVDFPIDLDDDDDAFPTFSLGFVKGNLDCNNLNRIEESTNNFQLDGEQSAKIPNEKEQQLDKEEELVTSTKESDSSEEPATNWKAFSKHAASQRRDLNSYTRKFDDLDNGGNTFKLYLAQYFKDTIGGFVDTTLENTNIITIALQ
jgi:hypothetical protein